MHAWMVEAIRPTVVPASSMRMIRRDGPAFGLPRQSCTIGKPRVPDRPHHRTNTVPRRLQRMPRATSTGPGLSEGLALALQVS